LPKNGNVLVGVGQEVAPNQAVARTARETEFVIVDASELLDIPRHKVQDYLELEIGSIIDEGTVLVRRKRPFGAKELNAPVGGMLVDVLNGRIVLQQTSEWIEIRAMVRARVVSYIDDKGVIIETSGSLVQGVWSSGVETIATKLHIATRSNTHKLTPEHINEETQSKILVGGLLEDSKVLDKAVEKEVPGLILGSMSAPLCRQATALGVPVILTDGIGVQGMSPVVFNLLQQSEGRDTSLLNTSGADNVPQIVVQLPPSASDKDAPMMTRPLQVGQIVRILRNPYINQIGEVVKLYTLAQLTPISAKAHGADVRLTDGRVLFVPSANLDAIV
jgi:hypothetical protein